MVSIGERPPEFIEADPQTTAEIFKMLQLYALEAKIKDTKNPSYIHVINSRYKDETPTECFGVGNEFNAAGYRVQRAQPDIMEITVPVIKYGKNETASLALGGINEAYRFAKFYRYSEDRTLARWWDLRSNGYQALGNSLVPWPDRTPEELLARLENPDYQVVPIRKALKTEVW